MIKSGDYVLATKYDDGDPGDHWALGFYDGEYFERHRVVDGERKQMRHSGFRRIAVIRKDVGRILLASAIALERMPPGTVNLWTMLTPVAFDLDLDTDA